MEMMKKGTYVFQNILNVDVIFNINNYVQNPVDETREFYSKNQLKNFRENVINTIKNDYEYPLHIGYAKRTLDILNQYKDFRLDTLFNNDIPNISFLDVYQLRKLKKQRKLHWIGLIPFKKQELLIQLRSNHIHIMM